MAMKYLNLFVCLFNFNEMNTDLFFILFTFKVDFSSAADRLFSLASDRNILGRNRNQLFYWAKR